METEVKGDQAFRRKSPSGSGLEMTYAGALSFLRRIYSRDLTSGVDIAITGIPFDSAVTNRSGTRLGPRALRAASTGLAELKAFPFGFDLFAQPGQSGEGKGEGLSIVDYGDCWLNPHRPETVEQDIVDHTLEIIKTGTKVVSMGGDHFISYPLLKAHHQQYGKLALVHFDAHCDTWSSLSEPQDSSTLDHGTMFLRAKEEGLIDVDRSIQIGLRTYNDDDFGFEILTAPWLHRNGMEATIEAIEKRVGDAQVYLSFDIDFLDPAYAPGTGTPVCGGVTSHQAMSLMQGLGNLNMLGMDLVEVSPAYDHAEITALAGATIIYQWLCVMAQRKGLRGQPVGRL